MVKERCSDDGLSRLLTQPPCVFMAKSPIFYQTQILNRIREMVNPKSPFNNFPHFSSNLCRVQALAIPVSTLPLPSRLAYLISSSNGDEKMFLTNLMQTFHPFPYNISSNTCETSTDTRIETSCDLLIPTHIILL